jgi:tetratricopeptide (TPR) repeat protein
LQRGTAEAALKKFQAAIADYNLALQLHPKFEVAYVCRSLDRLDMGEDIYAALRDIDTAIQLSPRDSHSYIVRGEIKVLLYNYDKAVDDYNISIKLNPNDPRAFYGRGVAYFHMESYDKSVSDLSRAIELKPVYGKAYWLRGDAKRLMKKFGYCEDYQKASRLHVAEATEACLKFCQVVR